MIVLRDHGPRDASLAVRERGSKRGPLISQFTQRERANVPRYPLEERENEAEG